MFNDQHLTIPSLLIFSITLNCGLFSQGCLGAIDGSHIHLSPPAALQSAYRNRKGFLSQNCLFICNFNMVFTYILTGWEGSATDSRVWADALAKGFSAPAGFYYLADSGFPHCPELLIPFRGVRYHLQEWGAAGVRYVFAGVGLLFYLLLFIVP